MGRMNFSKFSSLIAASDLSLCNVSFHGKQNLCFITENSRCVLILPFFDASINQ